MGRREQAVAEVSAMWARIEWEKMEEVVVRLIGALGACASTTSWSARGRNAAGGALGMRARRGMAKRSAKARASARLRRGRARWRLGEGVARWADARSGDTLGLRGRWTARARWVVGRGARDGGARWATKVGRRWAA
jgi:hypothetical protein